MKINMSKKLLLYTIVPIIILGVLVGFYQNTPVKNGDVELSLDYVVTYADGSQVVIQKPLMALQAASIAYDGREISDVIIRANFKSSIAQEITVSDYINVDGKARDANKRNLIKLTSATPIAYDIATITEQDIPTPGMHKIGAVIIFNGKTYNGETLTITTTKGGETPTMTPTVTPTPTPTTGGDGEVRITWVSISGKLE